MNGELVEPDLFGLVMIEVFFWRRNGTLVGWVFASAQLMMMMSEEVFQGSIAFQHTGGGGKWEGEREMFSADIRVVKGAKKAIE